jgi:hypothetical protein
MAELCIPDEVVIGFFTAVILGMSTAIVALWKQKK